MPLYAYRCLSCGQQLDVRHGMQETPQVPCQCGQSMVKDVAASFPHVELRWHKDQGIGSRLVVNAARRRTNDLAGDTQGARL